MMAVVLVKLMAAALGKATLLNSAVEYRARAGDPEVHLGRTGDACTKRILS
ncbi:MAG: hypothetical protein U0325_33100 [Polyangiales bacterium]